MLGLSSSKGILFRADDRSKDGQASYARFDENGKIEVLTGTAEDMYAAYKADDYESLGFPGAVLGFCVAHLPAYGIVSSLVIVLVAVIALLANILFNEKHNPLLLIQRINVCQPTDHEIDLAVAGMQAFLADRGF